MLSPPPKTLAGKQNSVSQDEYNAFSSCVSHLEGNWKRKERNLERQLNFLLVSLVWNTCQFARATTTKPHRLGGLKDRSGPSHSLAVRSQKSRCLQSQAPSGTCRLIFLASSQLLFLFLFSFFLVFFFWPSLVFFDFLMRHMGHPSSQGVPLRVFT